jgi:hypothetical protein
MPSREPTGAAAVRHCTTTRSRLGDGDSWRGGVGLLCGCGAMSVQREIALTWEMCACSGGMGLWWAVWEAIPDYLAVWVPDLIFVPTNIIV